MPASCLPQFSSTQAWRKQADDSPAGLRCDARGTGAGPSAGIALTCHRFRNAQFLWQCSRGIGSRHAPLQHHATGCSVQGSAKRNPRRPRAIQATCHEWGKCARTLLLLFLSQVCFQKRLLSGHSIEGKRASLPWINPNSDMTGADWRPQLQPVLTGADRCQPVLATVTQLIHAAQQCTNATHVGVIWPL